MSSTRPPNPRPTRPGGPPSRRQVPKRKRAASSPLWTRVTIVASVLVLIAAVAVFVHALTAPGNAPTAAGPTTGKSPFISHPTQHLVLGQPIDGIGCGAVEGTFQHIHQHFDVVINGKDQLAPAYVGIIPDASGNVKCLYWVHVHKESPGVIHVESPKSVKPTVGDFLDIWSVSPVDQTLLQTIESKNPDLVLVNGKPYTGDIRAIPLAVHSLITVEYGAPLVQQQTFDFSAVG